MITDCNTARSMEEPLNVVYMRGIRARIFGELAGMAQQLGMRMGDDPLAAIYRTAAEHLFAIENLCCDGDIDPRAWVRTCDGDEACLPYPRRLRVGFYPIAANPLHWGHLLIGLRAMACLQLDKVVYVISGRDGRKPGMCCADQRYIMAKDTLKLFGPLFACSSLARYSGCDGETNLFRFLKLNRQQQMDMFYIAGGDHYRRFYPGTEYPDTLVKLESHMDARIFSYKPSMHAISAALIERGSHAGHVETFLDVEFLQALPFAASSTMIRAALDGAGPRSDLALLPYSAYVDIRALNLYGVQSAETGMHRRRVVMHADAAMAVAC
jgi:nicotinic acid mononucleotide adenylyltransferase